MTLKSMFEKFDINLERMIVKYYKEMGLTSKDMVVLLHLVQVYLKKPIFSMQALSKRVDYTLKEVGDSIERLIDKGYVHIYHEQSKLGKQQEVFHLDNLFTALSNFLEEKTKVEFDNNTLQQFIVLLEQHLNREVNTKELQQIRYLIDEEKYSLMDMTAIVLELKDKVSLFKIEKMLSIQKKIPKIEVDQEQDRALEALFKNIK